jgi:hypothetical protein
MKPLEKLGITNPVQASQLISTLECITEVLAKAIAGDDSPIATSAGAFDVSIETATASVQLARISNNLRNPPSNQAPVTSNQ